MKDYTLLSQEEKDALVKKAMDIGAETETLYGNCIQSGLNGLAQAFPDMGITPEMIKGTFGLAGGCGLSLDGTCGALSAAAFAISLFYGRPTDDWTGDYNPCQAMIRRVMKQFEERYGSILCCDVLTKNLGAPYDWKTPEGLAGYQAHNGTYHDAQVVAFCNEIIARMIVDGELKYGGTPTV